MERGKTHISDAVRADLGKLNPEIRAGLLKAANADVGRTIGYVPVDTALKAPERVKDPWSAE